LVCNGLISTREQLPSEWPFRFDEFRFYTFGLRAGLANLMRNGTKLGLKKTVGKITQPINSYTRFPEYALMHGSINRFIASSKHLERVKVLDVGSPKCFGLYLASTASVDLMMTDISPLNIDEYQVMWKAIQKDAKGRACFAIEDARKLRYAAGQFDLVYSMSVVEHVEGETGDFDAVREMVRVLKPGGLLLLSVPFGTHYVEQMRIGLAHAVEQRNDQMMSFFQRIYDRPALERRILLALQEFDTQFHWTVWRQNTLPVRVFASLGQNAQGALGFVNPWMSLWANRCGTGIVNGVQGEYGQLHSPQDLYGDFVVAARKAAQ
jgi:SAM-dependent methyltransferase